MKNKLVLLLCVSIFYCGSTYTMEENKKEEASKIYPNLILKKKFKNGILFTLKDDRFCLLSDLVLDDYSLTLKKTSVDLYFSPELGPAKKDAQKIKKEMEKKIGEDIPFLSWDNVVYKVANVWNLQKNEKAKSKLGDYVSTFKGITDSVITRSGLLNFVDKEGM